MFSNAQGAQAVGPGAFPHVLHNTKSTTSLATPSPTPCLTSAFLTLFFWLKYVGTQISPTVMFVFANYWKPTWLSTGD